MKVSFQVGLRTFLWNRPINSKSKEKIIDENRYEFMVYRQLQKGIGDITVHIKESKGYRSLEDELINLEYWTTHKQKILTQLNMPLLSTNIVDILEELQTSIESKYEYVNRRIRNGENTTVKVRQNKQSKVTHWTLPYTPIDNGTNNHFFKNLPTKNISEIAQFVDQATGYGKAFTHLQPKSAKVKPVMEIIHACVIANATGTEIKKMIDICDIYS